MLNLPTVFILRTLQSDDESKSNCRTGGVLPGSAPDPQCRLSIKRQPLSSALFTGRIEILNKLESFFEARTPGHHSRREFLLHGMGGAGKTQLALKFAERCKTRYFPHSLCIQKCRLD